MGKIIDITGQTFGFLTVIEPSRVNGRFGWRCTCECGNIIDIESNNLRSGRTQSCGCQRANLVGLKNKKDKVGQRIGSLVVLEATDERKNGSIVWKCQCDCGNICYVPTSNLRPNHTTSCGCQKYHITSEKLRLKLLGKKFGKLTVIEELPPENYESKWRCQCDCGNVVNNVTGWHLTKGIVNSCGCLISKGENKIKQLLIEHNIPFETQKTFDTCLSDKGYLLRFDFYVNNKYLIEYDGEQHFLTEPNSLFSNEQLEMIHQNDTIKDEWCKNNHIPLIRIKYTKYNTLCIEDLLLEEEQWHEETTQKNML